MGGVRWQPPFDSLELRTDAGGKTYCLMTAPGATSRSDIAVSTPGKFTVAYDVKGQHGDYEAEINNDGSLRIEFAGQSFTGQGCTQSGHVAILARPFVAAPVVVEPSLALKGSFCAAVLQHPDFKRDGLLWGSDESLARSCQWVVIDPNRRLGTDFASYGIGMGDPVGYVEAIGALQLAVKDYQATAVELSSNHNQWFYWGLIPFSGEGTRLASQADLKPALAAYAGAGGGKTPEGLIIGLYYHTNSHIQLLIDIGARDVARLDGSDSVMFGRGDDLLVGDSMHATKRIAQGWGFAFYRQ
jgi:hypothetical protein